MKAKKATANRERRQKWYDAQRDDYKRAHKRPGSNKK